MGWWKHLGSSFDIGERLRQKIRGVKWVNCASIHGRLASPSGICARVSVCCLRKIIKRLKWTAASTFSFLNFFSLFPSFPHTFDLSGKIKKKNVGEIDDSRADSRPGARARYLRRKRERKRSESGRICFYCDWSSKSTDEMLWWFSDFFFIFSLF
jgi:hypothetical protein